MPSVSYNSQYDGYDTNRTIHLLNTLNGELKNMYETNNTEKSKSLSNIYLYKKYKSLNYILFIILILIFSILFLTIIHKNITYFDSTAYIIVISVIISVGFLYVSQLIIDVLFRNNLNYDEYQFELSQKPTIKYKGTKLDNDNTNTKCNKK